jgi:Fic family protein
MAEKFQLKTRYQFAGIIEKRDRWQALRSELAARDRWERLLGPYWARQNCALDAISDPNLGNSKDLEGARALELQSHIAAAQMVMRFAEGKEALFSEDLLEIHRIMLAGIHPSAGSYRQRDMKSLGEGHEPTAAELVSPVVENALGWFQSPSFAEMHEVEKAALMLIKLVDIQPFDEGNGKTLRLFSGFFLLKAGYPPAIIPPDRAGQYAVAIHKALRLQTQPIIDLITEAVEHSLAYLLDEPAAPPKLTVLGS